MKKTAVFLLLTILTAAAACFLFSLPASAEAGGTDIYGDFADSLPEQYRELLPDGVDDPAADVSGALSPASVLSSISDALGGGLSRFLSDIPLLFSAVVLAALFTVVSGTVGNEGVRRAFGFCSGSVICLAAGKMLLSAAQRTGDYVFRLSAFADLLIPAMASACAAGGNGAEAAAEGSAMLLFLAVCENIYAAVLVPVVRVCIILSFASVFSDGLDTSGIYKAVKGFFNSSVTLLTTLLCAALGCQSALAAAADGVSVRAVKFVSGSIVPVIGNALGDTTRTVAASISLIRAGIGTAALAIILSLLLPLLAELLLSRLLLSLCSAAAGLLGCKKEGELLSGLSGACGMLVSVSSACAVMFLFALALFVRTAPAIGL